MPSVRSLQAPAEEVLPWDKASQAQPRAVKSMGMLRLCRLHYPRKSCSSSISDQHRSSWAWLKLSSHIPRSSRTCRRGCISQEQGAFVFKYSVCIWNLCIVLLHYLPKQFVSNSLYTQASPHLLAEQKPWLQHPESALPGPEGRAVVREGYHALQRAPSSS